MKVTITYDNTSFDGSVRAHWGFSCLVEAHGKSILFDTGTDGAILLDNMKKLAIDPEAVDAVFISHDHSDHQGGLRDFLSVHAVPVFWPFSSPAPKGIHDLQKEKGPVQLYPNVYSTGELNGIEQSLVVKLDQGVAVIVGCSHPGMAEILGAASRFGRVSALIGGLHGFDAFALLEPLDMICPTHCTRHIDRIRTLFPGKYIQGGAGQVIDSTA